MIGVMIMDKITNALCIIKVDEAIELEKQIKQLKKRLDGIKSVLTNIAYEDMDNRSIKFTQIYGTNGHFNVLYKEKLEIDNYTKLVEVLGEIAHAKIAHKEEIKYDVADRFRDALIALYRQEFSNETSVDQVLQGLGLEPKAIKTALKKLKGDYIKDKKVLESLGVKGDCEEELYTIRLYKNYELVERFFGGLTPVEIELVKKAIFVEEGISVGFEYNEEVQENEG
jgi:regulator of replication initiation timing